MSHFCKEINGQPTENDILLGRGGHNNKHSGNEKLRLMAMERVQKYMSCNKIEKSHMTMELALLVKKLDPPGRFLQKNPDDGNKWYEMDLKTARLKTSQVYRDTVAKVRGAADCTSDLREKSSKSHDFDEDAVKHLHTSTDHFHGFEDAVEPFSKYDDFGFDSDIDSLSFSSLQRITDPHSCQDLDGCGGLTSEILTDKIEVFDSVYDVSENLADLLNDTKVPPSFEPEPISESQEMNLPRNFDNRARRFQDNASIFSSCLSPPSTVSDAMTGVSNASILCNAFSRAVLSMPSDLDNESRPSKVKPFYRKTYEPQLSSAKLLSSKDSDLDGRCRHSRLYFIEDVDENKNIHQSEIKQLPQLDNSQQKGENSIPMPECSDSLRSNAPISGSLLYSSSLIPRDMRSNQSYLDTCTRSQQQQFYPQNKSHFQPHAAFGFTPFNLFHRNPHQGVYSIQGYSNTVHHASSTESLNKDHMPTLPDQRQQSKLGNLQYHLRKSSSSDAFSPKDRNISEPWFQPHSYLQSTSNAKPSTNSSSSVNQCHGNHQETDHRHASSVTIPSVASTRVDSMSEMNFSVMSRDFPGQKKLNDPFKMGSLQHSVDNPSNLSSGQHNVQSQSCGVYESYLKLLTEQKSAERCRKRKLA